MTSRHTIQAFFDRSTWTVSYVVWDNATRAAAVIDPTGCGDAYRAGLLYGIGAGFDWRKTGQLAAVMGALKIASRGGQNHVASRADIAALYQRSFGAPLW